MYINTMERLLEQLPRAERDDAAAEHELLYQIHGADKADEWLRGLCREHRVRSGGFKESCKRKY